MRLGCYGSLDQASRLKAAGFDFIEVNTQTVLRGDQPSSAWDGASVGVDRLPLGIEAASRLVPAALRIVGPGRDAIELQNYIQRIAKRAQQLGIGCLIFDSGEIGRQQGQVDKQTAREQLEAWVRMAGQVCTHHGLTFAIEAPCDDADDTRTPLDQVKSLCDRVNHRCVGVAINSRCLGMAGGIEKVILNLGDRLRYVRLTHASSNSTLNQSAASSDMPRDIETAGGSDRIEDLFCWLHKAGYDGPITIEGLRADRTPGEVLGETARLIRGVWNRSGRFDD